MVDPEQKSAWDDPLGAGIIVGRVLDQIGSQVPEAKRTIAVFQGNNILLFVSLKTTTKVKIASRCMIRFWFLFLILILLFFRYKVPLLPSV